MFRALASTKKKIFLLLLLMRFRLLWKLIVFIDIMGKVKIGFYCYVTADILTTKILQKCSLSNPLPNISFLSKPLNLIGCHGNQKAKFEKKYKKIIYSEAIRGIKLKVCRDVHNISLYKNDVFLLPVLMYFRCYGNLKFPLTYNGKSENWHLLLSHCR